MKKKTERTAAAALRTKAAKLLKNQSDRLTDLSTRDLRHLVTELGTHQIELEMQNEELRTVQEDLEASRLRYADLYNSAPIAYLTLDTGGNIREANLTAARMLGVGKGTLSKQKLSAYIMPGDRASFELYCASVLESSVKKTMEGRIRSKNKNVFWASFESVAVNDPETKTASLRVAVSNIHDRKQAEEQLRESETLFRLIAERSSEIIFQLDHSGRVSYISPAVAKTGYSPNEVLHARFSDFVLPADLPMTEQAFRKASSGTALSGIEACLLRRDGSSYPAEINVVPIRAGGVVIGIQGLVRDITERKKAEDALRHSEGLYRAIGESIDYGIWICDPQGRNIYASESLLKLVGITQDQCKDFGWGEVLHPDDAEATIAAWKQCVQTGGPWYREHRYRGVDGKYHPILACGVPVRDEHGQIIQWAGINLDISRLKRTEEELRRASEFRAAALDRLGEGLYTVDDKGLVSYMNPAAEELFGWSFEELRGKRMHDMTHHHYRDGRPFPIEECVGFQVKTTGQPLKNFEDVFIRKDGTFFDVIYSISPMRDAGGKISGLVVVFSDITERKRAEEALRQAMQELTDANRDLERFNRAAVGREQRMIELKKEVNALLFAAGQPPRYPLEFETEKNMDGKGAP